MKVLYCKKCGSIRDFGIEFTPCACGNMEAKWTDPQRGTVKVRAKVMFYARIIGMNNRFLTESPHGLNLPPDEQARMRHEIATTAPGYLFDKSNRNCWAVIIQKGDSSDVVWEDAPVPPGIEG